MHCEACGSAPPPTFLTSGRCPRCGGALRSSEAAAPYRDAASPEWGHELARAPAPYRELPSSLGWACPRCAGSTLREHHGDRRCDHCGGEFLSHTRLEHLLLRHREQGLVPAGRGEPALATQTVSYLRCPVCTQPMNRRNFGDRSGVLIDVCRGHGVWFDAAELDAAVRFALELPEGEERAALQALVRRPFTPPPPRAPQEPHDLLETRSNWPWVRASGIGRPSLFDWVWSLLQ